MKKKLFIYTSLFAFISAILSSCLLLNSYFDTFFSEDEEIIDNTSFDDRDNGNSNSNNEPNSGSNSGSSGNGGNISDSDSSTNTNPPQSTIKKKNIFIFKFNTQNEQVVNNNSEVTAKDYFSIENNFPSFDKNGNAIHKEGYVFAGWSLKNEYTEENYTASSDFTSEKLDNEEKKTFFTWSTPSWYSSDISNKKHKAYEEYVSKEVLSDSLTQYTLNFNAVWIPDEKFYTINEVDNEHQLSTSEYFQGPELYNAIAISKSFRKYIPKKIILPSKIGDKTIDTIYKISTPLYNSYSIVLPKTVSNIHGLNFGDFVINAFEVDNENPNLKVIDGVLYSKDGKILYCFPAAKSTKNWVLPEGVEKIDSWAFRQVDLSEIDLTNIKTIAEGGLAYTNLMKITLPVNISFTDSRQHQGHNFYKCRKLEEVTILASENPITLPKAIFSMCSNLTTVYFKTKISAIRDEAFSYCTKLKTIHYIGSKEEWNSITLGKDVFKDIKNNITVSCNDGELIINLAEDNSTQG